MNSIRGLGLAALVLAAGAGRASADSFDVNCPGESGFVPTGGGCGVNPHFIWPDWMYCESGKTFWIFDTGVAYGGTIQDGISGCAARCTISPTNGSCISGDIEWPTVAPPPSPNGPTCPPSAGGLPVSLTTGAMFFSQTDAVVGEVSLSRSYNSGRGATGRYGMFGPGWNASVERRLVVLASNAVTLRDSGGDPTHYFDANADGLYEAALPDTKESWLQAAANGYEFHHRRGGVEAFDPTGRLVSDTDAAGVATTYGRDSQGRLTSVTRRGRTLTIAYSEGSTRPSRVEGPGGVLLVKYTYNPSTNFLETVTYADGSGFRYHYDDNARILLVEDHAGKLVEAHQYDGSGRAITSERGGGQEKLTFSFGQSQTTVTDALGNTTTYDIVEVNHLRRVNKTTGPCQGCGGSGGSTQEWTYDARGNALTRKDAAGQIWTYTYSADDDVLTETDPLDQVTIYTYDAQGKVLTRSGPGGTLTTTTHGPAGPLTITEKVTSTTDRTTTLTYNAQGKVATVIDPRNKQTTLTYNGEGDLTSVSDPLSHSTSFTYDGLGRRTTVTDALNHTTTTTYDGRGRVSRVTADDGTHTDFTYDLGGRRSTVTDPLNRTTRYAYDPYGRLEAVVDPMDGTTKYGYDVMSNLISLTDAKGQTTSFEYDAYHRVKKVVYPGGAFESFTYDVAGRLATRTDRKAVVTTYGYDVMGRLTGKAYSDGTPAVSYGYDLAGRLVSAANGTDTLAWTFDLTGQVVSESSTKNASTVAYSYDLGGNRLTVGLDGVLFVSYAYDDASRLTTITRAANNFVFDYDAANRRTSMTYPNGIVTSYSYDNLSRLTQLKADLGTTPITDFQYDYDAAGNRIRKQQLDYTEDYSYDRLYRLTGVNRTGASTGVWQFGYDAVGNRLTSQQDSSVTTSSYNEKNQLLSRAGGGLMRWRGSLSEAGTAAFTSALVNGKPARMLAGNVFEADLEMPTGTNTVTVQATDISGNVATKSYQVTVTGDGATYTYDANGNLVQKVEGVDTWTYEWNAENRLTRVTKNSTEQARFGYDPLGRRVEKVSGATTTTWSYDGDDILREVIGASTVKYVHGPGIDEPLANDDGSSLTYFQADGLGSVIKVTNSSGAITLTRQYDAWGNPLAGSATAGYAYTGREWDPATGLYYYRARYYDPAAGRFLSEDPRELRRYDYVDGRPADLIDPFGLTAEPSPPPPTTKRSPPKIPADPAERECKARAAKRYRQCGLAAEDSEKDRCGGLLGGLTPSCWTGEGLADKLSDCRRNYEKEKADCEKKTKTSCGSHPPGSQSS
jgi:RHS repeat-associated protein